MASQSPRNQAEPKDRDDRSLMSGFFQEREATTVVITPPRRKYQPQPIDVIDNRLCTVCAQLDFKRMFDSRPGHPKLFEKPRIFYWDLQGVRSEADCPFCHLLLKTLGFAREFVSLSRGTIRGQIDVFATLARRHIYRLWVLAYENVDKKRSIITLFQYCILLHVKQYDYDAETCSRNLVDDYNNDLGKARRIAFETDFKLLTRWLTLCEKITTVY
jgi:hypothetical protein